MARYITSTLVQTISGATTISSTFEGQYFIFTGTAPYTVGLPAPALTTGVSMTFYNSTGGTITLSSVGNFVGAAGSGTTTQTMGTGIVIPVLIIAPVYSTGRGWSSGSRCSCINCSSLASRTRGANGASGSRCACIDCTSLARGANGARGASRPGGSNGALRPRRASGTRCAICSIRDFICR